MFGRLPYRVQIPLGLSLAVLIAAILVTGITARVSAQNARQEILSLLDRAVVLVIAQVRPMMVADDTWRVFALLRDTAELVPGAATGQARLAILDAEGRVFAASDPTQLETGRALLGKPWRDQPTPTPSEITERQRLDQDDGSVVMVDPIRSEDGQTLGFVLTEVDAAVFAPDWPSLAKTALLAIALAVALLVPVGWWVGQRMTRVPSAPLRQVMLNLLLNAMKAAGEHGIVSARLEADETLVTFSVNNTGPPLSAEKFRNTLAAESGRDPRGFGLWVCQELASHHGGRFELDTTQPSQTRLVFQVPNREAPEETK